MIKQLAQRPLCISGSSAFFLPFFFLPLLFAAGAAVFGALSFAGAAGTTCCSCGAGGCSTRSFTSMPSSATGAGAGTDAGAGAIIGCGASSWGASGRPARAGNSSSVEDEMFGGFTRRMLARRAIESTCIARLGRGANSESVSVDESGAGEDSDATKATGVLIAGTWTACWPSWATSCVASTVAGGWAAAACVGSEAEAACSS